MNLIYVGTPGKSVSKAASFQCVWSPVTTRENHSRSPGRVIGAVSVLT